MKAYFASMSKKVQPDTVQQEEENLLRSLREHERVIETTSENAPLPAGVTHVLVTKPGGKPLLVERRKSFF